VSIASARLMSVIATAAAALGATGASAVPIVYSATGQYANVTLGSISFNSCVVATAAATCAQVTITANADTADVTPFSVSTTVNGVTTTNAGFEDLVLSNVTVSIYDPVSSATYTANILPSAQLFFSVDNTGHGAGFGSNLSTPAGVPYGPTYPLAVYDNAFYNGGVDQFATWNLVSSINAAGFTSFCPTGTACAAGPAIPTDHGDLSILFPFKPSYSYVVATLVPVPEPATSALMTAGALGLVAFASRRRRRRSLGA